VTLPSPSRERASEVHCMDKACAFGHPNGIGG
jgi:hypothetical protein